jgi:hypothetical protein
LPEALTRVADGGLAAMVAGDYFIGAWAMVLLHDYHHGRDFAASGGVCQKLDFLSVIHRDNVAQYDEVVFLRGRTLDFGLYSKTMHPHPGPYDFSLRHILNATAKDS